MRLVSLIAALTAVLLGSSPVALAKSTEAKPTIAVIGTGRVGSALGPRLAAIGHPVVYGSRNPESERVAELVRSSGQSASAKTIAAAAEEADWIVLAVPWRAVDTVLATLPALDGKLIVDVTNAVSVGDDGLLAPVVDDSGAEVIQRRKPDATVVKAFNTMGFHVMADPAAAGGPVSVPVASDSAEARSAVMQLVRELGFEPVDAGPLRHARILEGMAVLYMVPYLGGRPEQAFEYHLRSGTRPTESDGVRAAQ